MTADLTIGPPVPYGIQLCQLAAEFNPVLDLYRQLKPRRVLEIGTANGGTLYHWLQNATPETHIVTVDLPNPDYLSAEHLYPGWTPDNVTVTQIRGDSRHPSTIATAESHGPYQWLFIDGCHEYDYAVADWTNYGPLVEPGGLVLFHDIALRRDYGGGRTAGVHQLWRELQAAGYWTREFRADPTLAAYGIGAVQL